MCKFDTAPSGRGEARKSIRDIARSMFNETNNTSYRETSSHWKRDENFRKSGSLSSILVKSPSPGKYVTPKPKKKIDDGESDMPPFISTNMQNQLSVLQRYENRSVINNFFI